MNLTFNTKEQLIEALEAKRRACEVEDFHNVREHKAAEKKALAEFRASLREAMKWDYAEVKENEFRVGDYSSGPTCPRSMVALLDRTLAFAKASQQKRYVINKNARHDLYVILTLGMPEAKGLCA